MRFTAKIQLLRINRHFATIPGLLLNRQQIISRSIEHDNAYRNQIAFLPSTLATLFSAAS